MWMPRIFYSLGIISVAFLLCDAALPQLGDDLGRREPDGRKSLPVVVNTWPFTHATNVAWEALNAEDGEYPALDAVERGCSKCEADQCDLTVGFGGSPDETGETTLDAMIMDGDTMEAGAVASLRHVKDAISTARLVMERTRHTLLEGLHASQFALEMGLAVDDLSTPESRAIQRNWVKNSCQPNYRRRVLPDPSSSCGPYHLPSSTQKDLLEGGNASTSAGRDRAACNVAQRSHGSDVNCGDGGQARGRGAERQDMSGSQETRAAEAAEAVSAARNMVHLYNHDTIAMIAIDSNGSIAAGASSNGANHKVPGRVGDAAVPGAGAYADSTVGGCGATGDGDFHLRFLPCYQVVESMRRGLSPTQAAEDAIRRIATRSPAYVGAIIAVDNKGYIGAACFGWTFKYTYRDADVGEATVVTVDPLKLGEQHLASA